VRIRSTQRGAPQEWSGSGTSRDAPASHPVSMRLSKRLLRARLMCHTLAVFLRWLPTTVRQSACLVDDAVLECFVDFDQGRRHLPLCPCATLTVRNNDVICVMGLGDTLRPICPFLAC